MYAPTGKGGVGLPDLKLYWLSSEMANVVKHWKECENGQE